MVQRKCINVCDKSYFRIISCPFIYQPQQIHHFTTSHISLKIVHFNKCSSASKPFLSIKWDKEVLTVLYHLSHKNVEFCLNEKKKTNLSHKFEAMYKTSAVAYFSLTNNLKQIYCSTYIVTEIYQSNSPRITLSLIYQHISDRS